MINLSNKFKLKQISATKKALIVVLMFAVIESIIFLPVLYKKVQLNNLQLTDLESIEYVQYEKELFNSVILCRRYTEERSVINTFIKSMKAGKIKPYYKQKDIRKIIIMRTKSNKTIYSYINTDTLGVNYGKINIKIHDLDKLILKLASVELVEVQN